MSVSVVVPCFNVEEYVVSCVNSILEQVEQPLEIILIDNESTDNTLSLLKAFQSDNPRLSILVLNQPFPGASAARNMGLLAASGEWIQFLDADDLLLPEKLQHQIGLVSSYHDFDFIAGACQKMYLDGSVCTIVPKASNSWLALVNVSLGNTCSNLFRRESLLRIGGWDEALKSSQEYDLMFRLLKSGAQVVFDPEPYTLIRERLYGSISKVDILGNNIRRLNHLVQISNYFEDNKFDYLYLENVKLSIFQEIRRIYRIDKHMAIVKYHTLFREKPRLKSTEGTSWLYVFCFQLFGFRTTQRINQIFHAILGKG